MSCISNNLPFCNEHIESRETCTTTAYLFLNQERFPLIEYLNNLQETVIRTGITCQKIPFY